MKAYRDTGGIRHAVAEIAERIYLDLPPEDRDLTLRLGPRDPARSGLEAPFWFLGAVLRREPRALAVARDIQRARAGPRADGEATGRPAGARHVEDHLEGRTRVDATQRRP